MKKKIKQKGLNAFIKASEKGKARKQGQEGIKSLGKGVKIKGGKTIYRWEVKVYGEFGGYRLYGNPDSELGCYYFTKFGYHL